MPTSVEAVRNKGVCKTPLHNHTLKVIDYQTPTSFPSRREGQAAKAILLMREHTFDICKGVCKTPLHNIL